ITPAIAHLIQPPPPPGSLTVALSDSDHPMLLAAATPCEPDVPAQCNPILGGLCTTSSDDSCRGSLRLGLPASMRRQRGSGRLAVKLPLMGGVGGETRTPKPLRAPDPKSGASASSA